MITELIKIYTQYKALVFMGQATDEDVELLQDVSLLLQQRGVTL